MSLSPHIDTHLDLATLTELQTYLAAKLGSTLLENTLAVRELTLRVAPQDVIPTLTFLRDDKKCAFTQLMDLCGVDWLNHKPAEQRFDVVYHLLSLTKNLRVRVKVAAAEGPDGQTAGVPTAVNVYPNANWYERETWDMFGIRFEDHPDLRRILTDYDFDGHPLRKDFPLEGFVETYYDAEQQRVAYKPVDFPQEFRHFDKTSEWRGMTGNLSLADTDNKFSRDEFTAHGAKETKGSV